jgi:hypothetical protein
MAADLVQQRAAVIVAVDGTATALHLRTGVGRMIAVCTLPLPPRPARYDIGRRCLQRHLRPHAPCACSTPE